MIKIVEVIMNGCSCVCETADIARETITLSEIATKISIFEVALIIVIILLVIFGLIVGFYKLKKQGEDDYENYDKPYR